jgi:hypothetical protein
VLAVIARYESMLMVLADAGDRFAPGRLRMLRWTRREIDEWGVDFVTRLRVKGYAREVERLAGCDHGRQAAGDRVDDGRGDRR